MTKRVSSARGEIVDFDLMRIKETISNTPKPDGVKMRERFIDKKRRRNPNRKVGEMLAEQEAAKQKVAEAIANQKKKPNTTTNPEIAEVGEVSVTEVKPRKIVKKSK
jgi:hypothetical protein